MDVVLQIFKRSICPGTPFLESLAKKPHVTMDDLFKQTNKYSMLEDNVQTNTQQVGRRQNGQHQLSQASLTPLNISYNKLIPLIQDLADFRWPKQIKTDSAKWDKSKKCAYHKEHDHTTKQCRSFHYLVEKLLKFGHLKQHVCSDKRRAQTDQDLDVQIPRTSIAPRVAINYIHGGPTDEEYNSKRKSQILLLATSIRERINSIQPKLAYGSGPDRWDNHFSPNKPQPGVTATSRCPHPNIGDQRF
ncbi:hypothetical protein CK203_093900 [Vitis vinifera]|uniref:Uncharacterized protein n=1 Tax=Vitis vinifera TaxID=29760 RepID=A0A438C7M4_VITVI|nr:hypothetical protein CK203_093900 [Vitis vinifera]